MGVNTLIRPSPSNDTFRAMLTDVCHDKQTLKCIMAEDNQSEFCLKLNDFRGVGEGSRTAFDFGKNGMAYKKAGVSVDIGKYWSARSIPYIYL